MEFLKSYHSQSVPGVPQGKASFMSGYSAVRQQESRRDFSKAFVDTAWKRTSEINNLGYFFKSTHSQKYLRYVFIKYLHG